MLNDILPDDAGPVNDEDYRTYLDWLAEQGLRGHDPEMQCGETDYDCTLDYYGELIALAEVERLRRRLGCFAWHGPANGGGEARDEVERWGGGCS